MPWSDRLAPTRMTRVAVVAPTPSFRRALVATAALGSVDLEVAEAGPRPAADALRRLASPAATGPPRLSADPPDLAELERQGCAALLAGEVELERRAAAAITRGRVSATAGWTPASRLPDLSERLAPLGGAAVPLRLPAGVDPPTLLPERGVGASFRPLVSLYTTVPYRDVDPSVAAGFVYMLMFGMMFGDVGHGAILLAGGLAIRAGKPRWLARFRSAWPFVVGAGAAACGFGFAYGEAFGPTGAVPTLWLAPLDRPTALLAAGIGVGAVLLGISYVFGSVNRWREGGPARAAVAASGLAGTTLYVGLGLVGGGWYLHVVPLSLVGAAAIAAGVGFITVGLLAESGWGPSGIMQASIELFDTVVRLGSNVISFARLAAFGMTHAALGSIIWSATVSLWHRGVPGALGAGVVFLIGNAIAFALEALVAGVQALRLEYYELFSRLFVAQGSAFHPWHVPTASPEEVPCPGS